MDCLKIPFKIISSTWYMLISWAKIGHLGPLVILNNTTPRAPPRDLSGAISETKTNLTDNTTRIPNSTSQASVWIWSMRTYHYKRLFDSDPQQCKKQNTWLSKRGSTYCYGHLSVILSDEWYICRHDCRTEFNFFGHLQILSALGRWADPIWITAYKLFFLSDKQSGAEHWYNFWQ